MKLRLLFVICIWLIPTSIFAADSYLCIADKSTGFYYNKDTKEWESTSFKTDDKFILKKAKEDSDVVTVEGAKVGDLIYHNFGSSFPFGYCTEIGGWENTYDCKIMGGGIAKFSANKMTFLKVYTYGYWRGTDTPYMEIGKCSPL